MRAVKPLTLTIILYVYLRLLTEREVIIKKTHKSNTLQSFP